RTVAIKRMHPHLALDADFATMFVDEARVVSRIHHPNVVPILDVVVSGNELLLIMEYVHGEPLSELRRLMEAQGLPTRVALAAIAGALHGLHAAHEAKDEHGAPLMLVHRDVSPQNIVVGADGVPRVLDFGIAKAAGRLQMTLEGQVRGKVAYMAPEQM